MFRTTPLLTAAAATAGLLVADASAQIAVSIPASDSAQINLAGPRPRTVDGSTVVETRFVNVQADTGQFAAFGVIDFDTAGLFAVDVASVSDLSVSITQDNAGFTRGGNLLFFFASDTTDIAPGTTPAFQSSGDTANPNIGAAVVGTQLGTLTPAGSGVFTRVDDNRDTFALTLSESGLTTFINAVNADQTLRLLLTPGAQVEGQDPVVATFGGVTPRSPRTAPTLNFDATLIPEPASVALLGLGGLTLLRRRRA